MQKNYYDDLDFNYDDFDSVDDHSDKNPKVKNDDSNNQNNDEVNNFEIMKNEDIVIDSELESKYSLKWQKEIDLHRRLDSAIIVEGNVNDKQVYFSENGIEITTTDVFFYKYLHSIGYNTVIFFNHIEGFYNKYSKAEYKHFFKIVRKSEKEDDGGNDNREFEDSQSSVFGPALSDIRNAMKNTEEAVAIVMCDVSRYISNPNTISDSDHFFYSKLALSTKNICKPKGSKLNNILFLIADKSNDIPAWFYLNNPLVKTVTIPLPDMSIRKMYIDAYYENINENFEDEESEEEIEKNKKTFVSYTDGFKIMDLDSLRILMSAENLPVSKVSQGVSKFKYGVDENPWEDERLKKELVELEDKLKVRVKGQDAAIHKAAGIIKSAVLGLAGLQHSSSKSKPRGIMFLAGPTGVGKTELAKAISEWIFKSDSHVIRFDMSEYSQAHTDQRLLGAPPGYVGYEQGGQLTEAVKRDPFSVILFDEIEKAHPSILDKFLQILEDGRMTDGKGETVYFSDCLIIFTSNLGMFKETRDNLGFVRREPNVTYGSDGCNEQDLEKSNKAYDEYCKKILGSINDFFTIKIERPEIKNRIGENFIVFDFISYKAAFEIAKKQLNAIKHNLKVQKNIDLNISKEAFAKLVNILKQQEHISQGGRGVGNVIESVVIRPLSSYLVEHEIWEDGEVNVIDFEEIKGNYKIVCHD